MRRFLWRVLYATQLVFLGCNQSGDPTLTSAFSDDFERQELGEQWFNTGGPYKIIKGELHIAGAKNHPLWLKKKLPDNVQISFDVRSESSQGDIKFEIFGDGFSYARESSYTATGYVLIFGGWRNSKTLIARLDEHGPNVRERRDVRVEKGRRYRIKTERKAGLLRWWVDDEIMLEYDDERPLKGKRHDHFAFNNWTTPLYFDNLRIAPL